MRRMICRWATAGIFLVVAGLSLGADKVESTVAVEGNVGKPLSWTAAQLKTDFAKDVKTIKYTLKEKSHTATVVPLLDLVNAGGPVVDAKVKNNQLRFVVMVEGKDGYTAVFALAELLGDFGNREAWVALDMDDQGLSDRDAPANLIVPGDVKPGRWVHGIKVIRVVDLGVVRKE